MAIRNYFKRYDNTCVAQSFLNCVTLLTEVLAYAIINLQHPVLVQASAGYFDGGK